MVFYLIWEIIKWIWVKMKPTILLRTPTHLRITTVHLHRLCIIKIHCLLVKHSLFLFLYSDFISFWFFSFVFYKDKRKQHNCPFCDRSFTRPYRLNDHISFSHTDEVKILKLILAIFSKTCTYYIDKSKRENICVQFVRRISLAKTS